MNISNNGIEWLKQLEGFVKINNRHVIYDDATGQPVSPETPMPHGATIGYGHLIKPGEKFIYGIDEVMATRLLRHDVQITETGVNMAVKRQITQHQFDALVALAFNIGIGNFKKSTVLKYINKPDFISRTYPDLESAWMAWNKTQGQTARGLIKRRRTEWNLFSSGVYETIL